MIKIPTTDEILKALQPFLVPGNRVNPNTPLVTSEDNKGPIYIYQIPNTNPPVLVCQTSGAVDCDGQETSICNKNTDYDFQNDTSFHTSTDQPLDASKLPFYVLPIPGKYFDYSKHNIVGGQLGLIIYDNGTSQTMNFGVFGDEDAVKKHMGELSYAMADSLGIDPNPNTGGVSSGVTFIIFTSNLNIVNPIEDHNLATTMGNTAIDLMMQQIGTPAPSTTKFNIIKAKDHITIQIAKTGVGVNEACQQACDWINSN